jgi:hypothetical protein
VVLASEPATETEANLTAAWTKATLAEGEDASAQQQQQ